MAGVPVELRAPGASVVIEPEAGGRLVSWQVGGHELLVSEPADSPVDWGLFPMVPFAGRIREGRFRFGGVEHRLPAWYEGHAIHGTVLERAWEHLGGGRFAVALEPPWPWPGHVEHHVVLGADALRLRLVVAAASEPMPVTVGWHPWLRRQLADGGAVELDLDAGAMYERDAAGLPTGRIVAPAPPPWDDCFTDLPWAPVVRWPGVLALELETTCTHLVAYTERSRAVAVEPQTGPPDAVNLGEAAVVVPGRPLVAEATWRWSVESEVG